MAHTNALDRARFVVAQRGGRMQADGYLRSGDRVQLTCSQGHQWSTSPYKILEGDWCRRCHREHAGTATRRKTWERFDEFLRKRGDMLMSSSYSRRNEVLEILCQQGHRWFGAPSDVMARDAKCPQCRSEAKLAAKQSRSASRETRAHELALTRTGPVLQAAMKAGYGVIDRGPDVGPHRYELVCPTHGSRPVAWKTLSEERFCTDCSAAARASQRQKRRVELARQVAQSRGGRVVEDQVPRKTGHLVFECARGHQWSAPIIGVTGPTKNWCSHSECRKPISLQASRARNVVAVATRLSRLLPIARQRAEARGGVCLSTVYRSSSEGLQFRCARGHEFKMSFKKTRYQWCPMCSNRHSVGEVLTRNILELLLGLQLPPGRPKWLKSEAGRPLTLDGYNEEARIAFEYQGAGVHWAYRRSGRYADQAKFLRTRQIDELKRRECTANGVTLLIVWGEENTTSIGMLTRKVMESLRQNGVPFNDHANIVIDPTTIHSDDLTQRVHDYCASRGGRLLSEFVPGMLYRVEVECGCGRRWQPVAAKLLHVGTWCRCRPRPDQSQRLLLEFDC